MRSVWAMSPLWIVDPGRGVGVRWTSSPPTAPSLAVRRLCATHPVRATPVSAMFVRRHISLSACGARRAEEEEEEERQPLWSVCPLALALFPSPLPPSPPSLLGKSQKRRPHELGHREGAARGWLFLSACCGAQQWGGGGDTPMEEQPQTQCVLAAAGLQKPRAWSGETGTAAARSTLTCDARTPGDGLSQRRQGPNEDEAHPIITKKDVASCVN